MILTTQVVERASAARSSGIIDRTGPEERCDPPAKLGQRPSAAAGLCDNQAATWLWVDRATMPDLAIGLILIVFPGFFVGVLAMLIAANRGRSRRGWFLISYLVPVLSFFAVGLLEALTNWGDALRYLWFGSYFVPLYVLWRLPTLRRHVAGGTDRRSA